MGLNENLVWIETTTIASQKRWGQFNTTCPARGTSLGMMGEQWEYNLGIISTGLVRLRLLFSNVGTQMITCCCWGNQWSATTMRWQEENEDVRGMLGNNVDAIMAQVMMFSESFLVGSSVVLLIERLVVSLSISQCPSWSSALIKSVMACFLLPWWYDIPFQCLVSSW